MKKIKFGWDTQYEQFVAGHNPPKIFLKNTLIIDKRILKLVEKYYKNNILNFIRSISHNIALK